MNLTIFFIGVTVMVIGIFACLIYDKYKARKERAERFERYKRMI